MTPLRIVLIGFGPVGVRFAEELIPELITGRIALTIVGGESGEPYNRVMIAEYAAREAELDELVIADRAALEGAGATLLSGARAERIDREAHTVVLHDGQRLPYDGLVLATGARANVPHLDGLERTAAAAGRDEQLTAGVCVLRTAEDAAEVREVVADGGSVAVLGAGVLGIELALLLAGAGAEPSLAHFGPTPMPRQLDRNAASLLSGALERAGVHVLPHTRAEAIVTSEDEDGQRRFRALVSSDGKRIEADLLILSCGVSARTELAEAAGLRIGSGVLVDAALRSWSDQDVYAIGDCAHVADRDLHRHDARVPGGPSGLVGPGWRQAEWLADRFLNEVRGAPRRESFEDDVPGVVTLKGDGIDLVAAGDVSADPFARVPAGEIAPDIAVWADPAHGNYVKMVTRAGSLTGFVCLGMPRTAAELSVLYVRRGELPADRSLLLRLDAAEAAAPRPTGREGTVCICNAVTSGMIEDAISDGCRTVADVGGSTRAGTGCGGCRARIGELIAEFAAATA